MTANKKLGLTVLLVCIMPLTLLSQPENKDNIGYEYIFDQKISMRDGIQLSAVMWKPKGAQGSFPAVFVFTPYMAEAGQRDGKFFARNGYVCVYVDVRGRNNSEGEFFPFENHSPDCHDVVEWIASQPWCNGQVAMMGGSYAGLVQWQTIKELPPHLVTIIPNAASFLGFDVPQPNNIYNINYTMWLAVVAGRGPNFSLFGDSEFWHSHYYKLYAEGLPFEKFAEITGINKKFYERWMAHPAYDDFWKSMNAAPEDYQRLNIPVLSTTGYFDGSKAGTLHHYHQHMKYGNEEAKRKHYLIVGPWDHAGTKYPKKKVRGFEFGDNYAIYPDMRQMYLEWFDWIVKGKAKPEFLKKNVSCFMMNGNEWHQVDNIEDLSNAVDRWYLSSEDGMAHDVFNSGFLTTKPADNDQKPDIFAYDPLNIINREDFMKEAKDPAPYVSQRLAFGEEKLIYHSPPLREELQIAGYVKVKLHVELNVPDTDLQVVLYEIRPDGTSLYLAQGWIRARYRNSLSKPELVKPGEINVYEFKILDFFARKLKKGSRLRLLVSSVNTPMAQKNYNSGGDVSKESAKDARTAIIKVYHDKSHPSVLELPVKK
ncbi:CocE/NonD family hydrolase [Acidobacteriota bacterium]